MAEDLGCDGLTCLNLHRHRDSFEDGPVAVSDAVLQQSLSGRDVQLVIGIGDASAVDNQLLGGELVPGVRVANEGWETATSETFMRMGLV